jgi:hypothetical protein
MSGLLFSTSQSGLDVREHGPDLDIVGWMANKGDTCELEVWGCGEHWVGEHWVGEDWVGEH